MGKIEIILVLLFKAITETCVFVDRHIARGKVIK